MIINMTVKPCFHERQDGSISALVQVVNICLKFIYLFHRDRTLLRITQGSSLYLFPRVVSVLRPAFRPHFLVLSVSSCSLFGVWESSSTGIFHIPLFLRSVCTSRRFYRNSLSQYLGCRPSGLSLVSQPKVAHSPSDKQH